MLIFFLLFRYTEMTKIIVTYAFSVILLLTVILINVNAAGGRKKCKHESRFHQLGYEYGAGLIDENNQEEGTSSEEGEAIIDAFVFAYNTVYPEANIQSEQFLDKIDCARPFLEGIEESLLSK